MRMPLLRVGFPTLLLALLVASCTIINVRRDYSHQRRSYKHGSFKRASLIQTT